MISGYGILGAAIATTASLSVLNLLAAFFMFKKINVDTIFFGILWIRKVV